MEGLLEPWENCGARARQDAPDRWIDVWWSLRRCGVGGVEALTGRTTVEGGRETEMAHPSAFSASSESQLISVHSAHSVLHCIHCIQGAYTSHPYNSPIPTPNHVLRSSLIQLHTQYVALQQSVDNHIPICRLRPQNVTPPNPAVITRPRSKLRPRQPGTTGLVFRQRVAKKAKKNYNKKRGNVQKVKKG
ncbi:hypothetical protein BKA56DRAFT_615812 [Ilyonectria sp. MPI-CAGE-AT-0026]|nr:hypothetical protein BKA56DRAFT_615812 [Ilyonectria sp. MPI-CAGE-AT-0026]